MLTDFILDHQKYKAKKDEIPDIVCVIFFFETFDIYFQYIINFVVMLYYCI